jgi:N-methylhydantoinase A
MLLSDLRRDYLLTQIIELKDNHNQQITDSFIALENKALQQYSDENIEESRVTFRRFARCRYQNQEHTVEIPFPVGNIGAAEINNICEQFHEHYEREYTYRLEAPVELVCYHLIAIAEMDKIKLEKSPQTGIEINDTVKGTREVDFVEHGKHDTVIYDGNLFEPGISFNGPAIVEESGTTIIVPPGFKCSIDDYGNYRINLLEEGV